jgi:hypothetical protein
MREGKKIYRAMRYKVGSTRRTPFAYPKTKYSAWSSRFLNTTSVFPHPSFSMSPTPSQQTTVGPTRRPPLFLIHPPPPLFPPLFPRAASLSSPTAPPSPSSCRRPAGGPPLPAVARSTSPSRRALLPSPSGRRHHRSSSLPLPCQMTSRRAPSFPSGARPWRRGWAVPAPTSGARWSTGLDFFGPRIMAE